MNISPLKENLSTFSINLYAVMRPSLVEALNPTMSQFGSSAVASENVALVHIAVFCLGLNVYV